MMGAGGGGGADQQQDQGSSFPPSLFTCNREDSITPATVFVNPNEIHQYKPEQRDQDHDQQQLQQQHQGVQEHQATQYYQLTQAQGHRQHVQGYHQQQGQGHQQVHLQGADQQDEVVGPRGERFGSLGNLQFTIIEASNPSRRGSVEEQVIYTDTFPVSDSSDLVEDNSNSSHSFVYMDQGHQQNIQGHQQGVRGDLDPDQGNSQLKVDIVPTKSEYIWPDETPYMTTGNEPSPTGLDVSTKGFAGVYQFQMKYIQPSSSSNSKWEYSKLLSKLYIDMNTWLQIEFYIGERPPPGLIIRALPVFCEPAHIREPVRRCPAHRSLEDPVNVGFEHSLDHIIRIQGEDDIMYDEDATSKRLSTYFPTGQPHKGTAVCNRMIKFMCLGSDVGGMARKPIKVIFTLELQARVVGRNVVDVRICSCPKRDLNQEEAKFIRTREKTRELADK
ncbi:tumor protein 63 isoform X2 [Eurytemora carolleeae]|nr:tumor protein 63 isoform X2 [Eurytemora carolleeae]|eukprot:XP_023339703.1 tumor protein 63-like isoform X2 [Eurytemora affinis]